MTIAADTLATLGDVLAHYGIEADAVHDIRAGRANKHWRVAAAGAQYALRHYARSRTDGAIAYEHAMLAHVRSRGWPVAAPVTATDGGTTVTEGGSLYALFPFLGGRPAPYNNARYLRIKGRLLARLHRDLASAPAREQRLGFRRVWEVDDPEGGSLSDLLRAFGRERRAMAAVFRHYRYSTLRELSRLGYGELPDTVVHWDFHHDNLLFQRGELTALLDFDSVHQDARVADIAQSVLLDCLEPPAHNAISVAGMRAFVAGYHEAAPLDDAERALIVPLLPALVIARSAVSLRAWLHKGNPRALRSLERAAAYRLPVMEAQRSALEDAVADATR
ncbi:MAG: phosphotransferase [Dehalococcoidia bacterium]